MSKVFRASLASIPIATLLVVSPLRADESKSEKTLELQLDRRMQKLLAPTITWDLNLDGGYGHVFADPGRGSFLGRARAGVLVVRDPIYWALGATYEASVVSKATFGLEAEATWLTYGPWAQAGASLDADGKLGGHASIGIAVIGAELQVRDSERFGSVVAFYGKLHLPLSIFVRAIVVSEEVRREKEEEERKQGARQSGRSRIPPLLPPSL